MAAEKTTTKGTEAGMINTTTEIEVIITEDLTLAEASLERS